MIKRSHTRAFYIFGIVDCLVIAIFSFKAVQDYQRLLSPYCRQFCGNWIRLRNENFTIAIIAIIGGLIIMYGLRLAKKRDRLRQLAAQHALFDEYVAKEQLIADNEALTLPLEIRTRFSRRSTRNFLAMTWGFTSIIVIVLWIEYRFSSKLHTHNSIYLLIIISLLLFIYMTGFVLAITIFSRRRMVITEDGIAIHSGGKSHRILWHEAQLFARPPITSPEKTHPQLEQYEIASASARVLWNFAPEQQGFIVGLQPTMPYAEYARIMKALPSLIAAKTGLPLYDLRKQQPDIATTTT